MSYQRRQSIWLVLCLMSSSYAITEMGIRETFALETSSGHTSNLQAQLPSSFPQLQLNNIQIGADGFALQINGIPQIGTMRVIEPDRVILDLQATKVLPKLHNATIGVNRFGVRQIRVAQFQNSPAITRLVFDLDNNSQFKFLSSFEPNLGIFWLRPTRQMTGAVVSGNSNSTVASSPRLSLTNQSEPLRVIPSIEGLAFNGYGQLVIQTSRAIAYQGNYNLANNTYSVTLPDSRISEKLRRPLLGSNSPIEQIRLNQVGKSVVVSVKTVSGWQIASTSRTSPLEIALQLNSVGKTVAEANANLRSQNPPMNNILRTNPSNNGRVVAIDAGHGGPDVGATRNGIYEKDINLAMSQQLGQILQAMGYGVIYTRTADIDLDLAPRVQIAENSQASVFVSVHVNSLDANASGVNGVETYHAPSASLGKTLADLVHQQIIASTGANDRGVRSARFHVIVKTSMPAILVETGFITNPAEAAKLVSRDYQERMAQAIAKGVDQFLRSYPR